MLATAEEKRITVLTEAEARAQISRIKGHWQAFWFELKDFHERKGWLPLAIRVSRTALSGSWG